MTGTYAMWNGERGELEKLQIPAMDRSLFFGDAVYEVIRIYKGNPFLLKEHLQRLARSLDSLRIQCNLNRFETRLNTSLAEAGVQDGYIYCQISRGSAPRNHLFPPSHVEANELIYVQAFERDPHWNTRKTGMAVITHEDIRWARRDIKTVNLLGNCLAKQAAAEKGCEEVILIEKDGTVTEAASNNVFIVKDGKAITRPLSYSILPGITRAFVLGLAKELSIPTEETLFNQDQLRNADEVFITGTFSEVLGITQMDQKPVSNGMIGPITAKLAAAYRNHYL